MGVGLIISMGKGSLGSDQLRHREEQEEGAYKLTRNQIKTTTTTVTKTTTTTTTTR